MYKKEVLVDRLDKCKAEVKKALAKAKASGGQRDIDFFQNCSAQLVILIHTLTYDHVENLLEIGAIKQMAWCYNNGFLVDGQTEAFMKQIYEQYEDHERRADERHKEEITAINILAENKDIDGVDVYKDGKNSYIDISSVASVFAKDAGIGKDSLASRIGEKLREKNERARYLKKHKAGRRAGYYQIYVIAQIIHVILEERDARLHDSEGMQKVKPDKKDGVKKSALSLQDCINRLRPYCKKFDELD